MGWNGYLQQARTRAELVHGYEQFGRTIEMYSLIQLLPLDDAAAQLFDDLRQQRVRIGTMDLRIAASALAHGLVVLTRNAVDFSRVPGLRFEDWTK
jgi:tRNA(fMet)-specific endonuclease VapC